MELPFNKAPFKINLIDHYTFKPLGSTDFAILKKKADDNLEEWHLAVQRGDYWDTTDYLAAPKHYFRDCDALDKWAHLITHACRELTAIRNNMLENDKIYRAGSRKASFHPKGSQLALLQGERGPYDPRATMWFATALLNTPSRCRRCILFTWTWERVKDKQVLRSEMLAFLLQLEVAGNRKARRGETCIGITVSITFLIAFWYTWFLLTTCMLGFFLLSSTCPQTRVLEARIEKPDPIPVFVREVLKDIPLEEERDQRMKELVLWAIFTDSDNEPNVTAKRAETANNKDKRLR
ncbi:hypothetical protein F4679DRAFT_536431 [Xylaria curta]|nr:hypothetical protein F4679DRAFT_536431 [Xylaria curta]